MTFKVGDSIGIYGENDPVLVERILKTLPFSSTTQIKDPRSHEMLSLHSFLSKKANLSRLTPHLTKILNCQDPTADLLDALTQASLSHLDVDAFIGSLLPLLPRFYSVASSPLVHPNEVHLIVSLSTYQHKSETRYGVASYFLSYLAQEGITPILSYVQPTPHFTLPQREESSMIMVGPGTGVAPFRGFLQERVQRQSSGKHWLFFGERHQAFDFYYRDFWMDLASKDLLQLELAFSRDQESKIYVQHRLLEKGEQIWDWLSEGAYFYVCGEAEPMAKEVEKTIEMIAQRYGGLSHLESRAFIKKLRQEKRYLADVY